MKKTFLLFFVSLSIFSFAQMKNLKKEIERVIEGKNATVAISILDFKNDKSININGNKKLPMLSVFKFHIALAVLDQVDKGTLSLDQNIFVKKSDLDENTYSPFLKDYPEGNVTKTLKELIQYMVSKSDNNITDVLINLLGGTQTVQNFANAKKIRPFLILADERKMHKGWDQLYVNTSTTNALNNALKKLEDGRLLSKKSSDFLINTMLDTKTGQNKIVAKLPKNLQVAHRTGSSGKNAKGLTAAENDIGIITLQNGRKYAISIMVSDSMESEEVNTTLIADLSKKVFDYFSTN